MELGRRLWGNRTLWTVLGSLAGLVLLVFGAGTTYSLLTPGYVFEQGELAAESGILAGSLALTVLSVYRSHALSTRVATERWLPERDERPEPWEDVQLLRLRTFARRAWGLVVLLFAVFIGCVTGLSAIEARSDALLDTGTRTQGMVDAAHESTGWGESTIWVQYETHSGRWRAEIVRSSDRTYAIGDDVTVVYDPHDPADVRTTEERNESDFATGLAMWPLLALLFLLPASVYAAFLWGGGYRAVRRTGWRAATVTVVPGAPFNQSRHAPDPYLRYQGRSEVWLRVLTTVSGGPGLNQAPRAPDLYVRYRDGSEIWLRAVTSPKGATLFKDEPDRPIWVGGTGRNMMVRFPRPGKEPLAMAVRAKNERHPLS